ncbi:hypothetical protein M427DRAFT_416304 [Gonapodya prolifera JEL478]|uniref:Uncharacterized protein n=1 Tax=Gonapodya prolifera (strain JEL478) TaxID=1344416 RepID=A0A139A5A3_GONPJ|nr:hypothetical protein M427DRAFT_416304 [Gonapodya prolifera JEL478]|eukprot:KXS11911.1 hypothetical protein M427DRAFT_416304 [Gonapodya prolifera JEL478]
MVSEAKSIATQPAAGQQIQPMRRGRPPKRNPGDMPTPSMPTVQSTAALGAGAMVEPQNSGSPMPMPPSTTFDISAAFGTVSAISPQGDRAFGFDDDGFGNVPAPWGKADGFQDAAWNSTPPNSSPQVYHQQHDTHQSGLFFSSGFAAEFNNAPIAEGDKPNQSPSAQSGAAEAWPQNPVVAPVRSVTPSQGALTMSAGTLFSNPVFQSVVQANDTTESSPKPTATPVVKREQSPSTFFGGGFASNVSDASFSVSDQRSMTPLSDTPSTGAGGRYDQYDARQSFESHSSATRSSFDSASRRSVEAQERKTMDTFQKAPHSGFQLSNFVELGDAPEKPLPQSPTIASPASARRPPVPPKPSALTGASYSPVTGQGSLQDIVSSGASAGSQNLFSAQPPFQGMIGTGRGSPSLPEPLVPLNAGSATDSPSRGSSTLASNARSPTQPRDIDGMVVAAIQNFSLGEPSESGTKPAKTPTLNQLGSPSSQQVLGLRAFDSGVNQRHLPPTMFGQSPTFGVPMYQRPITPYQQGYASPVAAPAPAQMYPATSPQSFSPLLIHMPTQNSTRSDSPPRPAGVKALTSHWEDRVGGRR